MSRRLEQGVDRPASTTILVDGATLAAVPGEMLLTALLAAGHDALRRDGSGALRGPFCNMGTCAECLVGVADPSGGSRRLRACLVPVRAGLTVRLRT